VNEDLKARFWGMFDEVTAELGDARRVIPGKPHPSDVWRVTARHKPPR
jgi:hypothetical protein